MSTRAHYPSGEPGTTGREPFEEGRSSEPHQYDGLSGQEGAGGAGGLATDAHGGTIARDTGVRDGEVVGLGGPKDSGFSSSEHGQTGHHGVGSGHGAGLGAGAGAAGVGAGLGAGSAQNQNFGAEHSSVNHGDSYGSRGHTVGGAGDKTGHLDQHAHNYESTGSGGPTSGGAANTDKFDTDRSGATGNSYGATDTYPDLEETKSRKGTGGIGGILGTSDKDFTANPSRTGKGAYNDDDAHFKTNTDGPSGHSALTGREGTTHKNPVAQAKGETGHAETGHGEKKGLMEKVKEVFH